ncbi:MAG: oligosaccharide flippase family protein, partial [Deltaproteobacteria bacterium]|nr:oligosaccharide flippase family protein [Deltaproteobacteria bacterium]
STGEMSQEKRDPPVAGVDDAFPPHGGTEVEGPRAQTQRASSLGDMGQRAAEPDPEKDFQHLVRSAAVNTLALIAGVSLTVFYSLAARVFGAAIYGLYAFSLSAVEVLMTVGGMATDKGLTRFVAAHHVVGEADEEASALGTGLWMTLVMSGIAALAAFVFAEEIATFFGKKEATLALRTLAPSILFGELLVILTWATIAAKIMRYKLYVKESGYPIFLMLFVLPLGLMSPTLETLCWGHVAASLVAFLWILWAVRKVYRYLPLSRALRAPLHREMIRFCIPMAMTDPLSVIVQRANPLIIGRFVSSVEIGVFAAADILSRAIGGATMAFDPVIMSVLAEATKLGDYDRLRYNLRLTSRWVAIVAMPIIIFFVLFRRELLLLYGATFASGSQTLLIFTGGRFVMAVLGLSAWVLPMSGRAKTVLVNQVVVSVISVIACYYLTGLYGIEGAALSWALSTTLAYGIIIVEIYIFERAHPFSWGMLRVMVVGAITLGVMNWLRPWMPEALVLRLVLSSGGMLLIYGSLFYLIGRSPEDDRLLRMLKLKK